MSTRHTKIVFTPDEYSAFLRAENSKPVGAFHLYTVLGLTPINGDFEEKIPKKYSKLQVAEIVSSLTLQQKALLLMLHAKNTVVSAMEIEDVLPRSLLPPGKATKAVIELRWRFGLVTVEEQTNHVPAKTGNFGDTFWWVFVNDRGKQIVDAIVEQEKRHGNPIAVWILAHATHPRLSGNGRGDLTIDHLAIGLADQLRRLTSEERSVAPA